MNTMNEQDGEAKRDWLKWELDTLQTEWERQQVLRTASEQGEANASQVAAGDMMSNDVHDVNEHDEWIEELYSAEEVERLSNMEQEGRDDH